MKSLFTQIDRLSDAARAEVAEFAQLRAELLRGEYPDFIEAITYQGDDKALLAVSEADQVTLARIINCCRRPLAA